MAMRRCGAPKGTESGDAADRPKEQSSAGRSVRATLAEAPVRHEPRRDHTGSPQRQPEEQIPVTTTTTRQYRDTQADVKLVLCALWIAMLFAYVDIFGFYRADVLDAALEGKVATTAFTVNQIFLTFTLIYILLPTLMVVLSLLLKPRVNRIINIAVSLLYIRGVAGTRPSSPQRRNLKNRVLRLTKQPGCEAQRLLPDAVAQARDQELTRQEIGQLLGLSGSTTARRYRHATRARTET
jgi:hypothetical protein